MPFLEGVVDFGFVDMTIFAASDHPAYFMLSNFFSRLKYNSFFPFQVPRFDMVAQFFYDDRV